LIGQRKRLSVGYVLAAILAKRAQSSMISLNSPGYGYSIAYTERASASFSLQKNPFESM
jgi:hypothetical protein